MTPTPEEIATKIYRAAINSPRPFPVVMVEFIVFAITDAVAQERERAAKIARSYHDGSLPVYAIGRGGVAAKAIERAIRDVTAPPTKGTP